MPQGGDEDRKGQEVSRAVAVFAKDRLILADTEEVGDWNEMALMPAAPAHISARARSRTGPQCQPHDTTPFAQLAVPLPLAREHYHQAEAERSRADGDG